MRRALPSLVLFVLPFALACGDDDGSDTTDTTTDAAAPSDSGTTPTDDAGSSPPSSLGGDDRPASIVYPSGYDPEGNYPLVIVLHGYGASGLIQGGYFSIRNLARELDFVALTPDGTENASGQRFWNATDACCAFGASVDDVAYISGLIDEAIERLAIDPARVYLYGHSNGGFMSYRMACDASDRITAIASLAGATWFDETDCGDPAEPVSVLQIHGTGDTTILFDGSATGMRYPSAAESMARFADRAGCADTLETGDPLDYDATVVGAETVREYRSAGCAEGTDFALWTIEGGGHIPSPSDDASRATVEWLLQHTD